MKTVSLRVTDSAIHFSMANGDHTQQKMIRYDQKQSLGANLENLRVQLAGVHCDAFVIENPLHYSFSDTIVGLDHRRIDIGLALTNMFNVPVVAAPTVQAIGMDQALTAKRSQAAWQLAYYGQYDGPRNRGQEAMLTVGNGFLGLRGAYVESHADDDNYPGFYVAGMYDQASTTVAGHQVENEDLVNLPDPQALSFAIDHGQRFQITHGDIKDVYRCLDLKSGQLRTTMLVALKTGHELAIETIKCADMTQWHDVAIRYRLTPLNFAGSLQVYATLDGTVTNSNVARYAPVEMPHLTISGMQAEGQTAALFGQTKHSKRDFAIASRLRVPTGASVETVTHPEAITQIADFTVVPQQTYTVDKCFSVYTRQETTGDLGQAALKAVANTDFEKVTAHTQAFFDQAWQNCDITVAGDLTAQKLLRVNIFHLFVAGGALASGELDASVGARGLHGEAYRGHVFWDEMFMLPWYAQHAPAVAKAMLMYRFKRLPQAQAAASKAGAKGAMYPWQSGSDGSEQSQSVHLNPLTDQWDPDLSSRQRHVSLAIAYDIWLYDHINQDQRFMDQAGMPMLVAIARFWLSKAKQEADGRYHIAGVMGPDEFHEQYPNSDLPGLKDNAYTNIMVAWLLTLLTEKKPAALSKTELQQMTTVSHKLALAIDGQGIIGQFAGYFDLATLDFDDYRKQYGDIARLDRILKAHGKTPDAYQVAKQADTLMAYFLFDEATVANLIKAMGYELPADYFTQNLQYYLDRTTHGSTLSRIVYARLDALAGRADQAWTLYHQALLSDYYDIQGGTTAEGLHLGVMAATLDVACRVFGGVSVFGSVLQVAPQLPRHWQQLRFTQRFRGVTYQFEISAHQVTVCADHDVDIVVKAKKIALVAGRSQTIHI